MSFLHHTRIPGEGQTRPRALLLLHGIYGARRNWASVARRLVRERPEVEAVTVDLRGHGDSPTGAPPHTVEASAADVTALVESLEPEGGWSILGHSFGGKVALLSAAQAARPPHQVWLIDSTPDVGPPRGGAWEVLEALRHLPGPFTDRGDAVAALEGRGIATPVAQWMATNVVAGPEGWSWRIDPDQMQQMLESFFDTDAWSVVEAPPPGTEIHFVKATESEVLTPRAAERILALSRSGAPVQLHLVKGGHWLNADNPDALHATLIRYL